MLEGPAAGSRAAKHKGIDLAVAPTPSIALIDYGAGNLASVRKAFVAAGALLSTPESPSDLDTVAGIVVPGVGHFGATQSLDAAWRTAITRRITDGCPLFGICLGMQWLFEGSTEAPDVPGLGVLAGMCARLDDQGGALKIPHVGWNGLEVAPDSRLLDGVAPGAYVVLHALVCSARDWRNRGDNVTRQPIRSSRRTRPHHGRAIPSREVVGRRTPDDSQFRGALPALTGARRAG